MLFWMFYMIPEGTSLVRLICTWECGQALVMEDLANEFREDFLAAVRVLEEFSLTDTALRAALYEAR